MRTRCAVILLALCAMASPQLYAFAGKEHRQVSAIGFQLALQACAGMPECALSPELLRELDAFIDPHSRLEYGVLVSSVDYRLSPLQVLQTSQPQHTLPSTPAALDPHLLELLTSGGTAWARAAAANDTHFQGELIAGIRNWHAYAVDVAAHDQNLFAALVLNSIADHFLQDFFAPGHIVTPRFGLHDAAASGLHNRYNVIGSTFVIDEEKFRKDLCPLLDLFLATEKGARFREDKSFFFSPVPLWGDSNLFRSPQQELLLILVEARSVLDILQSAKGRERTNSFVDVKWVPMSKARTPECKTVLRLAGGELPYGAYRHLQPDVGRLNAGLILGVSAGTNVLRVGRSTRTRAVYQADAIIYGKPPLDVERNPTDLNAPAMAYFRDRSWSARVGYVYEHNETEIVRGPAVRLVYAKPLIHIQLSADAAWKDYHLSDRSDRKLAYGIRLQTGFSMLNLDLGIGRDSSWTLGQLKPAFATRFGLSIAGPFTAIWKLGKIEEALSRYQRRKLEKKASDAVSHPTAAIQSRPCNWR